MEQRLPVLPEVRQQLNHVLQVALSLNGFVYIVAAALELVAVGGVLDDLPLLVRLDQPVINPQGHPTAVSELRQNCLFLR